MRIDDESAWALEARYGCEPVAFAAATWNRYTRCLSPISSFVALDFETTGLSCAHDEIIELAAVRVGPGPSAAATLQRLVRPRRSLPPFITRLTGLTDDELARDGVDPCTAVEELVAFIGDDPIVAYNARFDLGFLHAACEKHRVHGGADGIHSCALALARDAWPALANHKLPHVADQLGCDGSGQHRALGDARRAAEVYRAATVELLGLHHLVSAESRARLARMAP